MIEDVLEKRDALLARRPLPRGLTDRLEKLNLFDFLYNNLKLDGSSLTEQGVSRILEGGFVAGVSLREHNEIPGHRALLKAFDEMVHMSLTLETPQLTNLYRILTGGENPEFRRNTPILFHLDFTPPYYSEVPERLETLFRCVYRRDYDGDFIRRAADIHNGIIAVYPYAEKSEALARTALQFELVRNDLFPLRFGVTEQVYHRQVTEAIKSGLEEPFYRTILAAAEQKLDVIYRLLQR